MAQASTSESSMETGESSTSVIAPVIPQRRVVDANDPATEITDSKKPQVPQEKEKKTKVIMFIAAAHYEILNHFGLAAQLYDITLGDQIFNVLFTAYTILRQKAGETGGTLEDRIRDTEYVVTFGGSNISKPRTPIQELVEKTAKAKGLLFEKYSRDNPNNWYGIAGPLFNFLGGFKLRMKELRLGHSHMTIQKRGNKITQVRLSDYGIEGAHHILCEGVSFPPERRAAMPQSLGALAALICYLCTDKQYHKKYLEATKRAFLHFEDIDILLKLIKDRPPSEIRTLIGLLGDIALISTTREATRMFPPPAAFSYIFTRTGKMKINESEISAHQLANAFNFTGRGAFMFYHLFCKHNWTINLSEGTDVVAKQIVYHSMFGTYKEDFGILAAITNQANWLTREMMGKVFCKATTSGYPVPFTPIKQIYYSKMAQSNMTGLMTSNFSQVSSQPVFSGYTKRSFDDSFFEYLNRDVRESGSTKSIAQLVVTLSKQKESLKKYLLENGKSYDVGTKFWSRMDKLSIMDEDFEDKTFIPRSNGLFFLGRNDRN